jgi:hypothetical protein
MSASARQTSLLSQSEAKSGGAEEARTPDLQSAILALSQLSYCPIPKTAKRIEHSARETSKIFLKLKASQEIITQSASSIAQGGL